MKDYQKRFESRINKTETCWYWTGSISFTDFGLFWLNGKNVQAHRVSYELYKDEIPKGKRIEHTCKNRNCVNPDHLEISKGMSQEHKDKIGDANRGRVIETGREKGIKTSIYLYSKHLGIVSEAIKEGKAASTSDAVRRGLESL